MKRFLFLFLVATICLVANAQDDLKVKSFLPSLNDLTARTQPVKDKLGNPCALIKVQIPDDKFQFECGNIAPMIVGNVSFHTNEYWVYMIAGKDGAKHLKIKHPNYPTTDIVFSNYGFSTLEPQMTYALILAFPHVESKFNKTHLYIMPNSQLGTFNGLGVSVGGYLNNINLEAYYCKGLSKSKEIYWISSQNQGDNTSSSYTYKSFEIGGKVGYGIFMGEYLRFTPQVGTCIVSINGSEVEIGNDRVDASKGYSIGLNISIKADVFVAKWLSVCVIPQYSVAVRKSDLFERVSKESSKIADFGSGFNVKIGLSINL